MGSVTSRGVPVIYWLCAWRIEEGAGWQDWMRWRARGVRGKRRGVEWRGVARRGVVRRGAARTVWEGHRLLKLIGDASAMAAEMAGELAEGMHGHRVEVRHARRDLKGGSDLSLRPEQR